VKKENKMNKKRAFMIGLSIFGLSLIANIANAQKPHDCNCGNSNHPGYPKKKFTGITYTIADTCRSHHPDTCVTCFKSPAGAVYYALARFPTMAKNPKWEKEGYPELALLMAAYGTEVIAYEDSNGRWWVSRDATDKDPNNFLQEAIKAGKERGKQKVQ